MSSLPVTTAGPPTLPPIPTLTRRQENYARCVAVGMSYAEAFRQAGLVASSAGSMSSQIGALNKTVAVRQRIAELKAINDSTIESTFAERASWLRLVISADPAELTKIIHDPCGSCWPDKEIADACIAHFAENPFEPDEPRPPLPDTNKPRDTCKACGGAGFARVVCTPTDELSPAGRALFKGAKQNDKGAIEVLMQDQAAALDTLNKMYSSYVTRSLNLNANVAVHSARDVTPQDALKLFDAFDK